MWGLGVWGVGCGVSRVHVPAPLLAYPHCPASTLTGDLRHTPMQHCASSTPHPAARTLPHLTHPQVSHADAAACHVATLHPEQPCKTLLPLVRRSAPPCARPRRERCATRPWTTWW